MLSLVAEGMASKPTPEDDQAELKCKVLESMREKLVKDIDPTKFLPFLRSKFVVDGFESATIKNCRSKSVFEGADKLVDVLCTKGAKGYDVFCLAILHDQTQLHILKALNKRLEALRHAKREQEKTRAEQEKTRAEQIRQVAHVQLTQERGQYHPVSGAQQGATSAHTTGCVAYIPQYAPRPQHQIRMLGHSRSPDNHTNPMTNPMTGPLNPNQQSAYPLVHSTTGPPGWQSSYPYPDVHPPNQQDVHPTIVPNQQLARDVHPTAGSQFASTTGPLNQQLAYPHLNDLPTSGSPKQQPVYQLPSPPYQQPVYQLHSPPNQQLVYQLPSPHPVYQLPSPPNQQLYQAELGAIGMESIPATVGQSESDDSPCGQPLN